MIKLLSSFPEQEVCLEDPKQETFGSSHPPKADPEILARFPSRQPSDPALIPAYEHGQLRLHQLLFQHLPEGVVTTDPFGLIIEANPAALEIFGRSSKDLEGQPVFKYLEDAYGMPLDELIGREVSRHKFINNHHVYVKRPDGSRRSCTLCAKPLIEEGTIVRAFGIFRDRTELEELVQNDDLTGLFSKRAFLERAEDQIRMCRRKHESLAVVYIDMRKFKRLNDRFGHAEGDRVLMKVGSRLKKAVYETDFCSRLHGDEYCVLLTRIGQEHLDKVAHKLAEATSFDIDLVDQNTGQIESVSVSGDIGICWREDGDIPDASALLKLADRAMFDCKMAVKRGEDCLYRINDRRD